jgi:hypothetical protein
MIGHVHVAVPTVVAVAPPLKGHDDAAAVADIVGTAVGVDDDELAIMETPSCRYGVAFGKRITLRIIWRTF